MKRRRVRAGDRVVKTHEPASGVGDVIRADGECVAVSFDDGVYRVLAPLAPAVLAIVQGGAS